MRVLIINTSEKTGGAAVASNRLMVALNNNGVKARMLVRDKQTDSITVSALKQSARLRWSFLWERLCVFFHLRFSRKGLFDIDIANAGVDVTATQAFQEADVIHLEWTNQGMLSLKGLQKILASGKPVVWTMHDAWAATAICHYTRGCVAFHSACRCCPLLPRGGGNHDLSARVWRRKQRTYRCGKMHMVCCSNWLAEQARQSALLKEHPIVSIPNPIDTHVFCQKDARAAKVALGLPVDKQVILFVSQKITNVRKGVSFFIEAIDRLVAKHSTLKSEAVVALLGGDAHEVAQQLAVEAYVLGYIGEEKRLVEVYNATDVFVIPSLEDNLPNTIMEAMACGVPCVGFDVGGIPEMIQHRCNGYVAQSANAEDLAEGIGWVLSHPDKQSLSAQALSYVSQHYSQHSVAMRYIEVYRDALAHKSHQI